MWNINLSNTHIIPFKYEYFEPSSLEEAVEILARYGSDAKILAGGTDLLVLMKMGVLRPKVLVNIKKIRELYGIRYDGDKLVIGSLTKLRSIEKNDIVKKHYYALYEAVKSMASIQIRNMGTIGGNLCNASPAADTAPPLLVYNARLKIYGTDGYREIPIEKFFTGPKKTVLKPGEILTEIIIPRPPEKHGSTFIKIARTSMDLAKVNIAVKLVLNDNDEIIDIAVALGSVAPTPVRAYSVEKALLNKKFSEETIYEASRLVVNDISPITDIRSTAEYRREVSKTLVYDALMKAYDRIKR